MIDYKKYRWFFTSSGKLVVGGKSAEQNEELVKKFIKKKENFIVIHTKQPGSPFSFILADIKKLNEKDLEEAAVFTACFSKGWKNKQKKVKVDIFKSKQIFKNKKMKTGTFGIIGKVKSKNVPLKLILKIQKGLLRTIPYIKEKKEKTKLKLSIIITPGSLTKEKATRKIKDILPRISEQEIMQALPARNIKIIIKKEK